MLNRQLSDCIFLVILLLICQSAVKAADMVISQFVPANNATEICADTKLWIAFTTVPAISTEGNLQICKLSDDSVVYQLNLQSLPSDIYGWIATGWPYQINLNGIIKNYLPFAVSGNVMEIHPSIHLDYNTTYYVKMTAGFCTSGVDTSPALTNNSSWQFTTKTSAPAADHDYLVDADGNGDFCTLQGATNAVADNDSESTIIKVKSGTYRELVHIPATKKNATWLGEDVNTAIIAAYNRDALNPGSDYRSMVKCSADGFRMYNITLQNTAGDNMGQAETIKHSGQKGIADNCKFLSWQDTLLLNGQMYFKVCYIEGDTDYIWGSGTVYFDMCQMKSLTPTAHM